MESCGISKTMKWLDLWTNISILPRWWKKYLSLVLKRATSKQIVVYANQWRFRLIRGVTNHIDYYFNAGFMDSNMILNQFIDVIMSYEKISVQVNGLVSDGGGSNEKIFNVISK